jgi:hypothetical protein
MQRGQNHMLKTVSALAAAAALAGAAILFPAMTPEVAAGVHSPAAKSARADQAVSCETQGWPYYDAACLRDSRRNAGRVPQVRMISTDRVPLGQPDAPVFEPLPQTPLQTAAAAPAVDPLAVPAWPDYLGPLKAMIVR